VRKYLTAQPARLSSLAELTVLGNQSLEMVQGYTRNKEDLLYALHMCRGSARGADRTAEAHSAPAGNAASSTEVGSTARAIPWPGEGTTLSKSAAPPAICRFGLLTPGIMGTPASPSEND
jgi:hypothetical protein